MSRMIFIYLLSILGKQNNTCRHSLVPLICSKLMYVEPNASSRLSTVVRRTLKMCTGAVFDRLFKNLFSNEWRSPLFAWSWQRKPTRTWPSSIAVFPIYLTYTTSCYCCSTDFVELVRLIFTYALSLAMLHYLGCFLQMLHYQKHRAFIYWVSARFIDQLFHSSLRDMMISVHLEICIPKNE